MLDTLTQYEMLCLVGGLIGVYVKLNADVLKLKGRVESLEKSDGEVKEMLTTLLNAVNEVKILLATHGIK
ncbi:MAG: hypothetical protein CMI29_04655 [Opitutae bacterium]|nr:hypothetical protein [Opitutae bacterium]|tara:strand:- start:21776 stop:21985 length:210 start_codon:yes stop_codon:yes gene_type:complete